MSTDSVSIPLTKSQQNKLRTIQEEAQRRSVRIAEIYRELLNTGLSEQEIYELVLEKLEVTAEMEAFIEEGYEFLQDISDWHTQKFEMGPVRRENCDN